MSELVKTTADYGIGSANADIVTESTEINALKSISKAVKDIDSLNLIQRKLFDRIEHTHQNFFIQGQAGTGKSTFIKYLKKHSQKRIRLVAPHCYCSSQH